MADYRALTRRAAVRYGLDPDIFLRQINQESGFNPGAVSPAGAIGIAQIMPETAKGWGVDPRDPVAALDAAAKNMAAYVRQFGSYRNALIAYNAGPGKVGKALPAETTNYIQTILGGKTPSTSSVSSGQTAQTAPASAPAAAALSALGVTLPQRAAVQVTAPTLPAFAAKAAQSIYPALPQTAQTNVARPRFNVNEALSALSRAGSQAAQAQTLPQTAQTKASGGAAAPTGGKIGKFDGKAVAGWIAPVLQYARQHGWKGTVNSGVRSYEEQKRIWDSGVRPAAKPGTSNHEFTGFPGGAVDVTQAAQLSQILRNSPYAKKLVWAGGKDPVHFSHPHGGSY